MVKITVVCISAQARACSWNMSGQRPQLFSRKGCIINVPDTLIQCKSQASPSYIFKDYSPTIQTAQLFKLPILTMYWKSESGWRCHVPGGRCSPCMWPNVTRSPSCSTAFATDSQLNIAITDTVATAELGLCKLNALSATKPNSINAYNDISMSHNYQKPLLTAAA